MNFGITVTVSASVRADSKDESEHSVQVGFWGPKRKLWLSFLRVGENQRIIKKTWQFAWTNWKVWKHFRKLGRK